MAITYPLTFPTNKSPKRVRMLKKDVVAETLSGTSLQEQMHVFSGQRWEADITLPPMVRADAEIWITFQMKLRGKAGTFLFGDPAGETPLGVATGAPEVLGGSQTGDELITDGWTISTTGIMKAGDYISLGTGTSTQLYKVLDDADSNGSGEATLLLWPNLRFSPLDNDVITVNSAKGTFHLPENESSWDINEALHYGIAFSAVEAIPNG